MKKRTLFTFLIFGAILLLMPGVSEAKDKKEKIEKAPPFPRKGIWLNAQPDRKDWFRDKVTMVYFWDYTSINCIRELNYLKDWYARYHPYGLDMIFIHAPEFEFARKKENVEQALKRFTIPYPVFLDNDFKLWDKYGTRTWPMKYLVNGEGIISYKQGGEEGYLELENKIREMLKKEQPGEVLPDPVLSREINKFDSKQCRQMSGETYAGYERSGWWGGGVADRKGILPDETVFYRDRGKRLERGFFVEGLWANRKDYFEHARDTDQLSDYLGMIYVAHEVYAVLNPIAGTGVSRVYVTRDDIPVSRDNRGGDLKEDLDGNTYFLLQDPRLYYLITNEDEGPHEIKLWAQKKGASVSSFSFSNQCLSDFEHR